MRLAIIVAQSDNRVIGRDNKMPWYLPEDLKYFKRVTMGKPVIMGRKTYESIGRPLPGRCNLVVTRDENWRVDGVNICSSLDAAIDQGEAQALVDGSEEVIIMGGAQIYAQMLPNVQRLYLTQVHGEMDGDAFFPELDMSQWQEIGRQDMPAIEPNPYPYSFIVLERVDS